VATALLGHDGMGGKALAQKRNNCALGSLVSACNQVYFAFVGDFDRTAELRQKNAPRFAGNLHRRSEVWVHLFIISDQGPDFGALANDVRGMCGRMRREF